MTAMMSYQELKNWLNDKENKQKVVYGFCFVLVFIIGFGAGKFDKDARGPKLKTQSNYTTNIKPGTTPKVLPTPPALTPAQVLGTAAAKVCPVKGNASSKIYHLPGGAFYNTLKSPRCFFTEAEAQAAGFRKSGR